MPFIDETAAELLASVLFAAGRRLTLALTAPRGRKRADIDLARWFDTYALADVALPPLSGTTPEEEVGAFLRENSVQAVLQELLAARLTDAPELEAERLSRVFISLGKRLLPEQDLVILFLFFDEQVCGLVGRLGSADPGLLHHIRQEAYLSRIVAAIDRHAMAAAGRLDPSADQDFLARYRGHVADWHGRLQPPDFDRRRLISIGDLYVSPTISHLVEVEAGLPLPQTDIWQLDDELDHTVLLGDPGGGKTTASNVLMHRHAVDDRLRVPFLVTLREFASSSPPARSVLRHVEHNLETFYQCRPPGGLVENIMLNGSALVIFDGLDELLDTSRRSEISSIIERFCAEYPLAHVLVTSRTIGYDQARLDDRQFECYQISGFSDEQIKDYVHKWFACQDGIGPGEAESFLAESRGAGDLRSNPLLLALMCILYRGEGSIPRSRPEIYEKCAILLFRRWDASRKIHMELRARNLVEPALRHLAYWLLTRADAQSTITERELVAQTMAYFLGRGFESPVDAEDAATEFVEFCRGRLWVLTEAGTTEHGDPLFAFTHRTFLEYFAAAYLASTHDSPEQLARNLEGRIAKSEWDTVAQLAVQIKDHASERGGERIFQALLADRRHRSVKSVGNVLGFLGRCTEFIEPAPATVRALAARAFAHAMADPADDQLVAPLAWLMVSAQGATRDHVAQELEVRVGDLVSSDDPGRHLLGLRLALQLGNAPHAIRRGDDAWTSWDIAAQYETQLISAAQFADDIAAFQCYNEENAAFVLAHRSDLPEFLFKQASTHFLGIYWISPARNLLYKMPDISLDNPILGYIHQMLESDSWVLHITGNYFDGIFWDNADEPISPALGEGDMAQEVFRVVAYIICVFSEKTKIKPQLTSSDLGSLSQLRPYLMQRWGFGEGDLSALPVDKRWQAIFTGWAAGEVSFNSGRVGPMESIK
jgi:hypothetical protein